MSRQASVSDQVRHHASKTPQAIALLDVDGRCMNYEELNARILQVYRQLRKQGIGKKDRIAILLPSGSDWVAAFLAASSLCAAVPMNPSGTSDETQNFLKQFRVTALISSNVLEAPALLAARNAIPLIQMNAYEPERSSEPITPAPPQLEDLALLLATSGTTSRPKVVPLTHENVAISAHHLKDALQLTSTDRCLNLMPLFHRSGISATLCSLVAGASVVIVPAFSALDFFDWMQRFSPTWYAGVPAMHRSILARSVAHRNILERHPLRFIRSSSSTIPDSVAEELKNTFHAPLIQTYNTTETALISATSFLPSLNKKGSVGRPASGEVAILDEAGGTLGPMAIGRIAVRGPNVMRGYEDDETANRTAFVNGWFQTGDTGYLDEDNHLFLKGRATAIINRAGQKLSPEEIEEVLLLHPAVEHAAAFAIPDPEFEEIPACAIVLRQNCNLSSIEIQEFLAKRLSAYKIPASVAFVEELPVTATGKIDRPALAKIRRQEVASTPIEEIRETITALWKSVLRIDEVELDDRFFQLGGDSLLATQLANRLQEKFHLNLSIGSLFETSTIRLQSQYIAELQNTKNANRKAIARIPPAPYYPVSFPQQRLWFLYQLAPDSPVYNIAKQLTIRGPLNVSALEKALQTIVERHESLRTNFISIDGIPQQIIKEMATMPIHILELSNIEEAEQEIEIERLRTMEAQRPFNLEQDFLIRAMLLKRNDKEHVLLLINHHIISDRWSVNLFLDELQQFYSFFNPGNVGLPQDLPIQYRDFASFQRRSMEDSDEMDHQLLYWRQQLSDAPLLNLPVNWADRAVADFKGAKESLNLNGSLIEKIHEFCKRHEVTPFLFYLTVIHVLLHRYSGQKDVLVGSPISGRFQVETEQLLGFLANTLVLRGDLSGEPAFLEFLLRNRDVLFNAFANQNVPFEKVVEELNPSRSGGHSPLFDVVLTLIGTTRSMAFDGLDIAISEIYTRTAKFPLTLSVEETSTGLLVSFQYSTSLFSGAQIAQMLWHFGNLIESALRNPNQNISQLEMLTMQERERLLSKWSRSTDACDTDSCMHEAFEEIAEKFPDAIAVKEGPLSITYRELNAQSNSLAHYLCAIGITAETAVGIAMDRGVSMIVSLLAILKAGGTYVPIDPAYPDERVQIIIDNAQIQFLITNELERFANYSLRVICPNRDRQEIERGKGENLGVETRTDSVCYILYTSGSTGKPKGVCASHRGVLRIARGLKFLKISSEDRFLQHSTIAFDASTFEIWGALLNGACLVIPPANQLSLQELGKQIVQNRVSILWLTSALFSQMVEHASDSLIGLRYLLAGGDVLDVAPVKKALERLPQVTIVNGYGPTETTTFACCHVVSECNGNSIPIGRPIANTTVYILDPYLEPVPVGVEGQLYIGGDGLARGYCNDPSLTEEKFIRNPFEPGARLYATGDTVRWLPDSTIEFAGRLDNQLKIRGFRVEPGEIEAAILLHPSVLDCSVVAKLDSTGEKYLLAYVVADPFDEATLKQFLATKLPQYMIPSRIMILGALPLNASGKVDRLSLPAPSETRRHADKFRIPPRDALEFQLVDIWQKLLKVQRIGITDDFFQLGGHSLLAAQLFARIHKLTGKDLPLSVLFETPTVKGIAQILRNQGWLPDWNNLVAIQPAGSKPPFFCVHSLEGNVLLYRQLAKHLGKNQPFFALQSSGLNGKPPLLRTIEQMASRYIEEIKRVQPEGPYYLGGASLGGVIAFEMARQLSAIGQEIGLLVAFDSSVARWTILKSRFRKPLRSIRRFAGHVRNFIRGGERRNLAVRKWKKWKTRTSHKLYRFLLSLHKRTGIPFPKRIDTVKQANFYAYWTYVPRLYPGKLTLFRSTDNRQKNPDNGWEHFCDKVEIIKVEGKHSTLLHEPYIRKLAQALNTCIETAGKKCSTGPNLDP